MKRLIRKAVRTTWYGLLAGIGYLTIYATDNDQLHAAYVLVAVFLGMLAITLYANRN